MAEPQNTAPRRRMPVRSHSTFATKTATDDAGELARRYSINPPALSPQGELAAAAGIQHSSGIGDAFESLGYDGAASTARHYERRASSGRRGSHSQDLLGRHSLTALVHNQGNKHPQNDEAKPRPGALPRPVGGSAKLGTFAGVFVPTSLNVLSILMVGIPKP